MKILFELWDKLLAAMEVLINLIDHFQKLHIFELQTVLEVEFGMNI